MAGHDRLNVFGDAEIGHRESPRDVTDWAKARGGYTLGDVKHYGLASIYLSPLSYSLIF